MTNTYHGSCSPCSCSCDIDCSFFFLFAFTFRIVDNAERKAYKYVSLSLSLFFFFFRERERQRDGRDGAAASAFVGCPVGTWYALGHYEMNSRVHIAITSPCQWLHWITAGDRGANEMSHEGNRCAETLTRERIRLPARLARHRISKARSSRNSCTRTS